MWSAWAWLMAAASGEVIPRADRSAATVGAGVGVAGIDQQGLAGGGLNEDRVTLTDIGPETEECRRRSRSCRRPCWSSPASRLAA